MMKDQKRTLTEIALDCGFSGSKSVLRSVQANYWNLASYLPTILIDNDTLRREGAWNMTAIKIIVAATLLLGVVPSAFAQSGFTTGSAAGNAAAGYPSPYGNGLYAYDQHYVHRSAVRRHR